MELEKKYLLKEGDQVFAIFDVSRVTEGFALAGWRFKEIVELQQGYLDCDFARDIAREICMVDILFHIKDARVRRQGRETTLTFKSDGDVSGLMRHKVEIPIEESLFKVLWINTEGRRVIKTRYIFTDGKHEIKINVYKDKPLMVAEVEFVSEEEAAAMVPFGKDVTADPKYKNSNLGE